jgi:hypothetical protein
MLRGTSRIKRRAGLVACVAVGASALSAVALAQTSHHAAVRHGVKAASPTLSGVQSSTNSGPGTQNVLPSGQVVPGNGTPPPGSTSYAYAGTGTGPVTQGYPSP